jgi:hypothetical protein
MSSRSWGLVVAIAFSLLALAGVALARPGGGESYSGGGGHGGGGGGDGDIFAILELVYWLIRLCIEAPAIGFPLLAIVVGFVLVNAYKQRKNKDWDSGPPVAVQRAKSLSALRNFDPAFSQVVFEDFVYRLFSTAHRARHSAEALAAAVGPYLDGSAREALVAREPRGVPVQQVIVGALRVVRIELPVRTRGQPAEGKRVHVAIELEANVATASKTYYSVETWLLGRDAGVRSKPPSPVRISACPNCGAPWQSSGTKSQHCASCDQVVDNGRFDWVVEQVTLRSIDERPPTMTTEVPERGTDLATYKHREAEQRLAKLHAEDPAVTAEALHARLELIYRELVTAWANNDLEPVRGLVSDGLYDYLDYWVQAYKTQGLRNALVDMRITRTELAKVVRDRWYDAITIRLWATGRDFVIDEKSGRVVRGSKSRERPYSEYWTLIRSAGRRGPVKHDRSCGNCGAPLAVTMAGSCNYCGAHVTSGEFDWVLSKIEQDDSYRG